MKLFWVLKQMHENAEESKACFYYYYYYHLKLSETNKQKPIIVFKVEDFSWIKTVTCLWEEGRHKRKQVKARRAMLCVKLWFSIMFCWL